MLTNEQFTCLAEKYIDTVFRVALNYLKSTVDAEDVTQNVFLKLLKERKPFDSEEHVKHWLIRVTVNECKSLWRTAWHRKTTYLEEAERESVFSSPEKSDLYYAVRELPVKYRQTVHLYYFEDYSVKEITEIMKLSETAVQTRLLRARQQLKEKLKEVWK